ncbi:hypothetical protein FVE85_6460 [Porphyridium purpureum]|uniref:Rhodanese domain-containing protein n=1 Tax=Porphyridium purpureum TaxID=35688 RepID=A0A5J4Z6B5_PORPP|nr:hypothetical protein FVE85_6460 [Porphyridium purpureum]|eukprot:POR2109..scf295_1
MFVCVVSRPCAWVIGGKDRSKVADRRSVVVRHSARARGADPWSRLSMADKAVVEASVLAALKSPVVLDVRDPNEVAQGKGGPPDSVPGAVHVPLNMEGVPQSERATTPDEFVEKLKSAGVTLDKNTVYVTHCGAGGRGGKAAAILKELGYEAYNGGGPKHVAESLGL